MPHFPKIPQILRKILRYFRYFRIYSSHAFWIRVLFGMFALNYFCVIGQHSRELFAVASFLLKVVKLQIVVLIWSMTF